MVYYAPFSRNREKGKRMKKCMEDVSALQARMKRIAGQVNGVINMIGEDVPCEDILVQLCAINGAVHKISLMILEGHVRHCVREVIEKGDADDTIESFAEALENFSKMA